jgi:hypothetical protein
MPCVAVQLLGGDRERRDVALVPVEDQQVARAVACSRLAGLDHHALVGLRRQGDRALERHVHRRHAERAAGQHQAVHALGDRVADHVRRVDVGAGRQVRAVLLHAACRQDHQRVVPQLGRDLGLGEVDEVAGRKHVCVLARCGIWRGRGRGAPRRPGLPLRPCVPRCMTSSEIATSAPLRSMDFSAAFTSRPRRCRCGRQLVRLAGRCSSRANMLEFVAEHVALRDRLRSSRLP